MIKHMQSRKILWLFIGCLFFKFILFDLDWSLNTTFSSFSFPQTYLTKFLLASLLAVPFLYIRSRWYLITVGTFTDFTNPVHTTDRFKVNSYHERRHLRTENYTVSLTVAYKFILALIPHLHSRTLNVITVSPDAASNLIHSFEIPGDPSGSYTRVLLANM